MALRKGQPRTIADVSRKDVQMYMKDFLRIGFTVGKQDGDVFIAHPHPLLCRSRQTFTDFAANGAS